MALIQKIEKLDGLYSNCGKSSIDWILGLKPKYMESLPRDPRVNNNGGHQYLYKSDGSNFKLITIEPEEDCSGIKVYYAHIHDLKRGCWAFGFWILDFGFWILDSRCQKLVGNLLVGKIYHE